jgi:hypothetical protein
MTSVAIGETFTNEPDHESREVSSEERAQEYATFGTEIDRMREESKTCLEALKVELEAQSATVGDVEVPSGPDMDDGQGFGCRHKYWVMKFEWGPFSGEIDGHSHDYVRPYSFITCDGKRHNAKITMPFQSKHFRKDEDVIAQYIADALSELRMIRGPVLKAVRG